MELLDVTLLDCSTQHAITLPALSGIVKNAATKKDASLHYTTTEACFLCAVTYLITQWWKSPKLCHHTLRKRSVPVSLNACPDHGRRCLTHNHTLQACLLHNCVVLLISSLPYVIRTDIIIQFVPFLSKSFCKPFFLGQCCSKLMTIQLKHPQRTVRSLILPQSARDKIFVCMHNVCWGSICMKDCHQSACHSPVCACTAGMYTYANGFFVYEGAFVDGKKHGKPLIQLDSNSHSCCYARAQANGIARRSVYWSFNDQYLSVVSVSQIYLCIIRQSRNHHESD